MSDLRSTLAELHRELTDARQLVPEERALLETTLREIERALERPAAASSDTEPARGEALEGAAVRLEAEHPGVASAVRAVVDALAKAGI